MVVKLRMRGDSMTKEEKRLLVQQAVKLTALGAKVEQERYRLRKMVEQGVPYIAPEMTAALERFEAAEEEWKRLEEEHLSYKMRN